jgi:hypothetical protein
MEFAMSGENPAAKAHEAIGAYFCAFSALEQELGETIKVLFQLQEHPAADAILAALGEVSKKIGLVRSSVHFAKNADGTDVAECWKEGADATMGGIWKCNDERNQLAHSLLQPEKDGSVKLTRLRLVGGKLKGKDALVTWTVGDFLLKFERLTELTGKLQAIRGELQKFKIPLPDLSWLAGDPYQPRRMTAPFVYLYGGQADTPLALKVAEQKEKSR